MGKHRGQADSLPVAPTVGIISLGCPKNLVDTESLLGRLAMAGYAVTADPGQADLLVVNTCGFIADAAQESREAIQEMAAIKAAHPGKRLVVTGCLAQRLGGELVTETPQIDVLLGSDQYDRLLPWLQGSAGMPIDQVAAPPSHYIEAGPRLLATPPHLAYVKIAEGCNNPCSFCIIPRLRGPYRSRHPDEILGEVAALVRQGVQEIVLISQDTTWYGRDLPERINLATLLQRLLPVAGSAWIRMLYLYPTLITEGLLTTMAAHGPQLLPYLDLPLQHSHSAVLARMQRAERTAGMIALLERIRHHLPAATLRATFIVGFPGETEEEFEHLYELVAAAWFDHVGVFTYSDEAECAAHELPDKVPTATAMARRDRLMQCQQEISRIKLARRVGQVVAVIAEEPVVGRPGYWQGRAASQAPEIDGVVVFTGIPRLAPGQIVPVRITGSSDYDLEGEAISSSKKSNKSIGVKIKKR